MENNILDRLEEFESETPNSDRKNDIFYHKKFENKMRYYSKASLLDRSLILEKAEKFENNWAIDSLERIDEKLLSVHKDLDSVMWSGYTSDVRKKLNDIILFLEQIEKIKDRLR